MAATAEEMQALVGHRFPGGTVTIERWESVLLADAAGGPPLPDGVVHPIWLFHGAIAAVGLTLRDLFALFRAESDEAIRGGGYEWTLNAPLREGRPYRAGGQVTAVERKLSRTLGPMDVTSFRIDLHDDRDGILVASTLSTWLVLRSGS